MLLDHTHRRWFLFTLLSLAGSTLLYVVYALTWPGGPSGGSVPGMLFGLAAAALMLFCGAFTLRKKLPRWRIGTAQSWLRAHIWLGLLSVPLVLFHSAFRWGGAVESWLLLVFYGVIASGVFGLLVQQYLPRLMKSTVPLESMVEQLPHICGRLRATADESMEKACGSLAPAVEGGATLAPDAELLRSFYLLEVRPFLAAIPVRATLAQPTQAAAMIAQLRQQLAPALQITLESLAALCEERRQLAEQQRLHGWLHGWLLIHLALSVALLVLGLAHAITATWY